MKVQKASLGRDMTASVNNTFSMVSTSSGRRAVCRESSIFDPVCQRSAIIGLADEESYGE
jgi:hypothetical protein